MIGVLISGLSDGIMIFCMLGCMYVCMYVFAESNRLMIVLCCFTDHRCVRHNFCPLSYFTDSEPHLIIMATE